MVLTLDNTNHLWPCLHEDSLGIDKPDSACVTPLSLHTDSSSGKPNGCSVTLHA